MAQMDFTRLGGCCEELVTARSVSILARIRRTVKAWEGWQDDTSPQWLVAKTWSQCLCKAGGQGEENISFNYFLEVG